MAVRTKFGYRLASSVTILVMFQRLRHRDMHSSSLSLLRCREIQFLNCASGIMHSSRGSSVVHSLADMKLLFQSSQNTVHYSTFPDVQKYSFSRRTQIPSILFCFKIPGGQCATVRNLQSSRNPMRLSWFCTTSLCMVRSGFLNRSKQHR